MDISVRSVLKLDFDVFLLCLAVFTEFSHSLTVPVANINKLRKSTIHI